jgi:O-antigen ligase
VKKLLEIGWQHGSYPFWILVVFIALIFFTGGSSRADIQSLLILRPVAIIICGIGLWTLNNAHISSYRTLFIVAGAILALAILQSLPLPGISDDVIWGSSPFADIDKASGIADAQRSISVAPQTTWNAIYSLAVPLAVFLLGVQLTREQKFMLLPVLLTLGILSGLLGLIQVVGSAEGPLYFYQITNNGSAVGFFANRNHQAVVLALLFPMLAVYGSAGIKTEGQEKFRKGVAIGGAIILIPLILVTGSRAGLIIALLSIGAAALLYHKPQLDVPVKRKIRRFNPAFIIAAIGVLGLGSITILMSRAQALERLSIADPAEDLRLRMWGNILEMGAMYFPWGSGIGSFPSIYAVNESKQLLMRTYVNQAHNDWLDLYVTSGIAGFAIFAFLLVNILPVASRAFARSITLRRDIVFTRLGLLIFLFLAIASLADYPLRVPIVNIFLVIGLLWSMGNLDQKSEMKTARSA